MANLYWKEEKAPKKEVYEALMKELVKCTDNAFTVKFEQDDSGTHVTCYVERNDDDTWTWKKQLPDKFMGWRLIRLMIPHGSIRLHK